jgi:hypothetical protein
MHRASLPLQVLGLLVDRTEGSACSQSQGCSYVFSILGSIGCQVLDKEQNDNLRGHWAHGAPSTVSIHFPCMLLPNSWQHGHTSLEFIAAQDSLLDDSEQRAVWCQEMRHNVRSIADFASSTQLELFSAFDAHGNECYVHKHSKHKHPKALWGKVCMRYTWCREKIWDHAAGMVILEEAGGVVSDAAGHPLDFSQGRYLDLHRGIIAATPELHGKLVALITAWEDV